MAALRGLSVARFTAPELRDKLVNQANKLMGQSMWKDEGDEEQCKIDLQGMIDGIVGVASSHHRPENSIKPVNLMANCINKKRELLNFR
jgi:hypothetical protein